MQPQQPQMPQQEAETTFYQPVVEAPVQQETLADARQAPLPQIQPVQWQAIEYMQQTKTAIWYVVFVVVVLVLMVLAIFVMKALTFALLLPVMAGALMVYSHRPPRQLSYALSEKGLYINDQLHPLEEFIAFGILRNEQMNSLVLIPIKRFRPGLTVYFPTEVGEQIVDTIGGYLPMEDVQPDMFDAIVSKLRM
jgi:hypothetical protein